MKVFVLDKRKKPLMPCNPARARILLSKGRAVVHKMFPFTIRLKDRLLENSSVQPVIVKVDPGAKQTGVAVAREKDGEPGHPRLLVGIELQHRGGARKKNMRTRAGYRRRRRNANTRYRAPRFDNRRRPEGWLAPSLQHRVDSVVSWARRLTRLAPVSGFFVESVKFDMQKMMNPEISGKEYQQGELTGYEVREYLLEKWGRRCAYCGKQNIPLQIEHIVPKARGGTNRVSNLTLACEKCNREKGSMPVEQFLNNKKDKNRLARIRLIARKPLHSAAAVNSTRNAILRELRGFGLPVETGSGARTKYNRTVLGLAKSHIFDALCVGDVRSVGGCLNGQYLEVTCSGRGAYSRTKTSKVKRKASEYAPPPKRRNGHKAKYMRKKKTITKRMPRSKNFFGFMSGDMVKADIPRGKFAGTHIGRLKCRSDGRFALPTPPEERAKSDGKKQFDVNHKYCTLLQINDGYGYSLARF